MTESLCSAAVTRDGYWTCDVLGGCFDCRQLARNIEDSFQLQIWKDEREKAKVQPSSKTRTI